MPEPTLTTDQDRWQAVCDRRTDADGTFYYAVTTTGIYCRPSCPSRHPLRAHVHFYPSAEAAEHAGFRACLRCRPTEVSAQAQAIARVIAVLEKAETPPTLPVLAAQIGWSPSHLQRVFKRQTGLSPREYAAARRAERLKAGLKTTAGVSAALYDAGYGSSRALYATSREALGMTPGTYQRGAAGVRIRYALADSPLGRFLLAATAHGVCALHFGEDAAMLEALAREFPHAERVADPAGLVAETAAVVAHLQGRSALELPIDVASTAFQRRVWALLREIPYGETRSYQEIAHMLGEPKAVRAVARACATNPVALLVPCHRVVRANGDLSGYRWGLERKRTLLARERASAEGEHGERDRRR